MKILFLSNFSLHFELVSSLPSSKWRDPRNRIVDRNRGKWVQGKKKKKNTSRPISRKVNLAKLFRRGGEVVRNQFDIQFLSLGRFVHHREKAERRLPRSTDSISWPTTRICQSKFPLPRKLSTKYNRALKAGRIEPRVATRNGGGERRRRRRRRRISFALSFSGNLIRFFVVSQKTSLSLCEFPSLPPSFPPSPPRHAKYFLSSQQTFHPGLGREIRYR